MRERGAKVTDIVILVVSAVESLQPQTMEVLDLVRRQNIPLIIAINKIDRPMANVEETLLDLAAHNLIPEQHGGRTICVPISAKEGTNLDILR